jgi:tetrathionate reductase subunit B
MKAFVIDVSKCVGCYACQVGCKDEHCGNDWTPYAKPQPDMGHFWGKLNDYTRGQVPKVKTAFVFMMCQHCANAPCIGACPAKAIKARADGLVWIDPKLCTGCRNCLDAKACPYGTIYFNEGLNIAQKCTGCAHLVDRKVVFAPRCVDNCATDAITFGEESDLSSLIAKAEVMHPEYGTKPRVYYLNLPKRFIAGTVYDPGAKEVVIGATVALSGDGTATATTDEYGDFWFEGLKVGKYSVKITKDAKTKTLDAVSTEKDVNLGDIALA